MFSRLCAITERYNSKKNKMQKGSKRKEIPNQNPASNNFLNICVFD